MSRTVNITPSRPLRSLLFAPGNDRRKLVKGLGVGADALVADLEDSVLKEQKKRARVTVVDVFSDAPGETALMVRINQVGSPAAAIDLQAISELPLAAILVPKATVDSVSQLKSQQHKIIAVVETAVGLREAREIGSLDGVACLVFGSVDLTAQIGLKPLPGSLQLLYGRTSLVIDSAAADLAAPIDGPFLRVKDTAGFDADAQVASALGFQGKVCIHPAQVNRANDLFTDESERVWAAKVMEAMSDARAQGEAVALLEGEMIDMATERAACRILGSAMSSTFDRRMNGWSSS